MVYSWDYQNIHHSKKIRDKNINPATFYGAYCMYYIYDRIIIMKWKQKSGLSQEQKNDPGSYHFSKAISQLLSAAAAPA